ncbi:outer membrane protein assembly factor BamC [Thiohalomonas denitrificans]|uniref:Outer membrane protein assembly factor BamC n=1 Tax=Thiohalomonas denitrificans TaxID=415747 RepID=A0A1G5PZP5_9GAMM|nr:outer membrane protein assembly factor BamC [Thiohalomonas denitrificans]SCZ54786.1 outer membrane protein assembly factor BamC [Thiohalomonas denitrificans]
MRRLILIVAALTLLSLVAGCSSGSKSTRNAEYRQAGTLPPLEIPPDLTSPVVRNDTSLPEISSGQHASVTDAGGQRSAVLANKSNVEVKGRGDQRWLQIDAAPEDVWNRVRGFWLEHGFELEIDEPDIGIMETRWTDDPTDRPEGFLRKLLDRLYSASSRDKFRVRLERTDDNKTELYLTHYGVEQVVMEQQVRGNEDLVWQPRPSDPELAQEMLNRIMVSLGVDAQTSSRMLAEVEPERPQAELVKAGSELHVVVQDGFDRAWRRTGIALDRIGFVVEDRNRAEGVYFVRYVDRLADAGEKAEQGWLSKLFASDDERDSVKDGEKARVVVRGDDRETRVALQNAEGAAADPRRAEMVLERLAQQLR